MNEDFTEDLDELADPINPFHGDDDEEAEASSIPQPELPPYRVHKGRYKGLVLPRMIGVKPSMMQKVEAVKQQILADPEFHRYAITIAQTYAELRREAEEKKAELDEIKVRLTAVMLLMVDQYEGEGVDTIKQPDGTVIRIDPTPHLIITDKPAFRQECIDSGLEALMTLPWGTANRLMKDRAFEGLDCFNGGQLYMRPKVVFTDPFKKKK